MYEESVKYALLTHKFTGKEHDAESGLDDFEARYYSSSLGRFMSSDEFTGGAVDAFDPEPNPPSPLPYALISNPQSLNKYVYAFNNPLRYMDPDGHDAKDIIILTSGPNHVSTRNKDEQQLGPEQSSEGAFLNLNAQIVFDEGDNLSHQKVTREAVVITEPNNKDAIRNGANENPDKNQMADEGNSKYVYDGPGKRPDKGPSGAPLPESSINAGYDAVFKITVKNTDTGVKTDLYYRVQFVIKNGKVDATTVKAAKITKDDYEKKKKEKQP
jgi:RHS repeat-associated protein